MSEVSVAPPNSNSGDPTQKVSFLEKFLSSFFQEKNIKWMLITGAAIVFSSSLMLVKNHFEEWPLSMQFLTILGYTAAVFGAGEICRGRLRLNLTYKVLHALTLTLLPISFMALRFLSSGTALQSWNIVEFCGLLLIGATFCWFAATRILDHLLRGRQTTFLFSFCVLCVAGAFPGFGADEITTANVVENVVSTTTAFSAFAVTLIYWAVMTAGVVKVNRHTFWLTEQHRLPRVFGFLPICILGLQFIILTATQTAGVINIEWLGLALVLFAATVLLVTRSIADVFRQRTGDLVRPLPWEIVLPMFCGLVMTAAGVVMSFHGFHYVGSTSYAVIPAAIVASVMMFMSARDTKHAGFVWAGLVCATIAYQCCPVLFSDVINSLKQTTAEALKRDRVPFSLYGVTYLPLLVTVAGISRYFQRRNELLLSRPLKHFVTVMATMLFAVSMTDVAARFYVSLVNIPLFLGFAVAFRDRRYAVVSVAALVLSVAFAIPALNDMHGYDRFSSDWIPTILAGVAVAMTATRLPDRILNTIPKPEDTFIRHVGSKASWLLETASGRDREFVRVTGGVLAAFVSANWIGESILHFGTQFSDASLLTFGLLMSAFTVYAIRSPHYLCGLSFWILLGFAGCRWFLNLPWADESVQLNVVSCVAMGCSLLSFLALRVTAGVTDTGMISDLRRKLGLRKASDSDDTERDIADGPIRKVLGFVVPLFDLSVAFSWALLPIHFLLLVIANAVLLINRFGDVDLLLSTFACIAWVVAAGFVIRSRAAGVIATVLLPLFATATVAALGIQLTASWAVTAWAAMEGVVHVVTSRRAKNESNQLAATVATVSGFWLQGLLLCSCLSLDLIFRLTAAVCLSGFLLTDYDRLNASRRTYFAIMANIQALMLAAGLGGCNGFVLEVFLNSTAPLAIPLLFVASAISVVVFDRLGTVRGEEQPSNAVLDATTCAGWAVVLRSLCVTFALWLIWNPPTISVATCFAGVGYLIFAATELRRAVQQQSESGVWAACVIAGAGVFFLFASGVISFGVGVSQFVLLGVAIIGLVAAHAAETRPSLAVLRRPGQIVGQTLPAIVAAMASGREFFEIGHSISSLNAVVLMTAAGIYFQQGMVTRNRRFAVMAAIILNGGVALLWRSMRIEELSCYLVPVGLSILAFVELLKKELPKRSHDPLRYAGALTILIAPMIDVIGGSWAHMIGVMLLSVIVILTAIGLRIRVLVYTGVAFLMGDLLAMVCHTSIEHPELLWLYGLTLGGAVIALAAYCENHRENVLARIRLVSAELATWN